MPATVPTSVYEITVHGEANGQAVLNVLHYREEQGIPLATPGQAEVLLELFQGRWQQAVIPVVHSSYFVSSYRLQEYTHTTARAVPILGRISDVQRGFQLLRNGDPANDLGALAGEPLPTFAAVGVRKFTPIPTRRFRGGMRIGPILESDTVGDALTSAGLGRYLPAQFEPLREIVPPAPAESVWQLCVFSERSAHVAAATDDLRPFTAPVLAFQTNPFVTSQVSRKRRAGGVG